ESNITIEAARVELFLSELRLPAIKLMWAALAARADKEGWPAARYERRSLLITANEPFGEWGKIFPDQAMTLAAIDRLVHHATILEMNVESYRRRDALDAKSGRGGR